MFAVTNHVVQGNYLLTIMLMDLCGNAQAANELPVWAHSRTGGCLGCGAGLAWWWRSFPQMWDICLHAACYPFDVSLLSVCLHLSLSSRGLITAGHRGKEESVTVTTAESDVQSDNAIISAEAYPCACCWASAKAYFGPEVWVFYCLHVDRAFVLVSLEMRFSLERSLKSNISLGIAEIHSDYQCFY